MTTKRQISGLLTRLAARNPDLALAQRFVILKPLRHVMRSISIDATRSADAPQFLWSLGHMFDPTTNLQGICLERFYIARDAPRLWSQPDMPEAFFMASENDILPELRSITTIEDMIRFRSPRAPEFERAVRWVICRIHFSAAFGRFDQVLRRFERIKHWNPNSMSWRRYEFEHVANELIPLVRANDRKGVISLLHAWEEDRVRKLGLESIYESTPFPLELDR